MKKIKIYNTNFELLSLQKYKTPANATYYSMQVADKLTGQIQDAVYFGNTKPTTVISINPYITKAGTIYNIAEIQPHQSRNRLGRFISVMR